MELYLHTKWILITHREFTFPLTIVPFKEYGAGTIPDGMKVSVVPQLVLHGPRKKYRIL
jgi:hypothetical protein